MQVKTITRSFLIVLFTLLTFTVAPTPVGAQTAPAMSYKFTVNTTHDTHDAHPGDGVCADKHGKCSVRAAIEEADALPSGSHITITVAAGRYTLSLGTLYIKGKHSIIITGASSTSTLINGNQTFKVMAINSSNASVSLSHLTIERGCCANYGGGISNTGTLSVSNSTLSGNTAIGGNASGGGIYNNGGTVSVSSSTLSGNSAIGCNCRYGGNGYGGGIYNNGGIVSVSSSTISGNSAIGGCGHSGCGNGYGGGIYNNTGTVSVSSSTLSNNKADNGEGGGIDNGGKVSVSYSTLSGNSAAIGGGIENYSGGAVTVTSSILSSNSARNGYGSGGGIDNGGKVSVSYSTLSNNKATFIGGGIYNNGRVSVSSSTLSGNSASYSGGGIENTGTMSVSNSTLSNNKAGNNGGGIDNNSTLTVSSSTLSGNSAGTGGGGIANGYYKGGTLTASNSTFSGNSAGAGGGIFNYNGTVTFTGIIVANSKKSSNCHGKITDGGYNLDSSTSCHFRLKTDLTNTNPKLGPLRDNGGPTQTMALLQGSKAIDWVALSSCPSTDQRGYPRPDNSESACDIGAYESAY